MKNNGKKYTHVIRSIEDAVGFDEEADVEKYEKFGGNKKIKKSEFDEAEINKKPSKLRDNRRTEFNTKGV